jgi:hypothetical protein
VNDATAFVVFEDALNAGEEIDKIFIFCEPIETLSVTVNWPDNVVAADKAVVFASSTEPFDDDSVTEIVAVYTFTGAARELVLTILVESPPTVLTPVKEYVLTVNATFDIYPLGVAQTEIFNELPSSPGYLATK